MARATTKPDLMKNARNKYNELTQLISSIPSDQINEPFQFDVTNEKGAHWERDQNMRDVLIHLHEWHKLLFNWIHSNQNGDKQPFLPIQYNWKTYGAMNIEFWKKHQSTSYSSALELFNNSHHQVLELAEGFTNDELFSRGVFTWNTSSPLGSYFISATASHYDWAIKKLKKHIKTKEKR